MTQVTTTESSPAVTPAVPVGEVTRVTDNAILVGVWSTPITVDTTSTFVATPGTGGSIIVQLSDDSGVTWRNVRDSPFSSMISSGVSPNATRIRASAIGATGTLIVDTPIATTYSTSAGGGGGGGGTGYLGLVATTGDLIGLVDATAGSTAKVGASDTVAILYELAADPYSVEANWQALQGIMSGGSVYSIELIDGKLPRLLRVLVPSGNQVTYTVGGVTGPVLLYSAYPHLIDIYDEPGVASPTSVTIQRTSGSDATGWFSLE